MTNGDDGYLWLKIDPVDADVAELEACFAGLAFDPASVPEKAVSAPKRVTAASLPVASASAAPVAAEPALRRRSVWPVALAAGLLLGMGLTWWMAAPAPNDAEGSETAPAVMPSEDSNPVAQQPAPSSGKKINFIDPFAAPDAELVDPFGDRQDLGGGDERPGEDEGDDDEPKKKKKSKKKEEWEADSPNLTDPFGGGKKGSVDLSSPDLTSPFGEKKGEGKESKPNMIDPFG